MKNLLIMALLGLFALSGCKDKKKEFNINPNAQIAISADKTKVIPSAPYSMETVVTYAWEIVFWATKFDGDKPSGQAIISHDMDNLKFWIGENSHVIYMDKEGNPQLGPWITSNMRDLVVVATKQKDDLNSWVNAYRYTTLGEFVAPARVFDTIGYVPNRVIKAAEAAIHTAFEAGDYERCTQLFETAYTFQPITGAEWRELKAQGIE